MLEVTRRDTKGCVFINWDSYSRNVMFHSVNTIHVLVFSIKAATKTAKHLLGFKQNLVGSVTPVIRNGQIDADRSEDGGCG